MVELNGLANGWVFVYELSGCGLKSSCSHLKFRFRACFEQEAPWHSGNYRVWIHSEMRTWHDKNIQSGFLLLSECRDHLLQVGYLKGTELKSHTHSNFILLEMKRVQNYLNTNKTNVLKHFLLLESLNHIMWNLYYTSIIKTFNGLISSAN